MIDIGSQNFGEKIFIESLYIFSNGKYEEATCKYYLTPRMLEQFHESTNEEIAFLELARMNYYDKGKKQ